METLEQVCLGSIMLMMGKIHDDVWKVQRKVHALESQAREKSSAGTTMIWNVHQILDITDIVTYAFIVYNWLVC